ncbi:MAG: copper chaperone PCu(A)C [Steroidobacteraceae bacterium]
MTRRAFIPTTLAAPLLLWSAACSAAAVGPAPARAASSAADAPAGIAVEGAWARATVPGQSIGAAYFTLVNRGTAEDTLLSVESPDAERAEVHESRVEDGMMRMRPAGAVKLAAGARLQLAPGGLHVMLIGLRQPLAAGGRVRLVLHLKGAGTLGFEAEVRSLE